MKKVLFITLLLSACNVLAQNKGIDTVRKYTFRDYSTPWPEFPLILLNDRVYEGNLANLNVKLKYIKIFSGPGASTIYGLSAANGVIFLGDKRKSPRFFYNPPTDTLFSGSVVYIRDGILSKKDNGEKKDILKTDVLKGDVFKSIYGKKPDSIIIITSRDFAIKSYKRKFSGYSESYHDYLESHKNNDNTISYIIDGAPIQDKESDEAIWKLYNVPSANIKKMRYSIKFREDEKKGASLFIIKRKTD